jgi:predicted metal-dependent HD superfamily phosphohydrolase
VDADLSILSQDPATYLIFTINVRKEYSVYPDFVYKTGRKNVLNHFLRMNQIYKTDFFFHRFEKKHGKI